MTSQLARKPAFWIVLLVASAVCVFSVLHWFGDAFSVLELDVRMSRTAAIDDARRLASEHRLIDVAPTQAVARFDGDSAAQTFIELEGGGKPALKPLLGSGEFTLYKWRVRLFTPGVEREVQIAFTPDGRPTGFSARIPEAAPGASLTADQARVVAVDAATKDWNVDFTLYRPLTASAITRPGKRVDHEFVYERIRGHPSANTPSIGDGRLRLTMVVAGDRLTQLRRTIYVPEAFSRRYATLRSVNDNIAAGASVAAGLLYGLGGCLVGLIWLMRRHALQWAPSAKWAAVVALLITGAGLANVSGSWFGYDTATSPSTHLYTRIGGALVGGVATWLFLTVIFATAEGMGRLAFAGHPQLWRTWRVPSANARQIWGRTLAGYAWIGFDLAFIALFYFVVDRYLGWWSPSDSLIDPNILGQRQPWLSPVSMALQAGMMEESLFRAIPLAGAALLGRHFGRPRLFIVIALVLQAVIFGCAHANYPGEPAYARPVELFLPALVWGIVYLRYGLVPGMLFHFGFDLVLMSIPLFVTDAPGIFFDRAMVVGILSLPLVVLVVQWLRAGALIDLPASERNGAALATPVATAAAEDVVLEVVDRVETAVGPTAVTKPVLEPSPPITAAPFTRYERWVLIAFAIVGVIGIGIRIVQPYDAPGLSIARDEALAAAEHALAERGIALDDRWVRSVRAVGVTDGAGADFVWREGGPELFRKLIGNVVAPPHWEVRFARFDGDVAERDAWRVSLVDGRPAPDGIRVIAHDVPEARAGRRLTEAEARPIAEAAIATWLKRSATSLEPRSAQADERPSRVDWAFIYADPTVVLPKGAEARIAVEIDGDEVSSVGRFLFIPDAWKREERSRNELLVIPRGLLAIIGAALSIVVLVSLVRRIARGEGSKRGAWVAALTMVIALSFGTWLRLDATEFGFTVAEPFRNQLLRVAMAWAGTTAAAALFGALVAAVGVRIASRAERGRPTSAAASSSPWPCAVPLALALLIAGVGGFGALTGTSSSPRVPLVGAADSSLPWLLAFMSELGFVTAASAALLGAAVLGSRKRYVEVLVALLFVVSAMLTRAMATDAHAIQIVVAGLGGLIAWLVYHYLIRDRLWLIPPTLLCLALIGQVVALMHEPWPGSRMATVLGAVATLAGYAIWRWLVRTDRRPSAAAS